MDKKEKQNLIDALKRYHDLKFTPGVYQHSIMGQAALSLENSEEVVRCKDCVWRKKWDKRGTYYCSNPNDGMAVAVELLDDDFCSYGKKRGDTCR